jgi:hypothetical protein
VRPDEQHLGGRICNYLEGSGRERIWRERISKQRKRGREGWIGHLLARREFDVSGLAGAPSTPQRAKSMDFIDFDVSERASPGPIDFLDFDVSGRAPPGPGGLKA